MLAILDLPEVRARVSPLSVEAYEALDDMGALDKQAELIREVIVKKMPKPPLRCKLIKRIFPGPTRQNSAGPVGTGKLAGWIKLPPPPLVWSNCLVLWTICAPCTDGDIAWATS